MKRGKNWGGFSSPKAKSSLDENDEIPVAATFAAASSHVERGGESSDSEDDDEDDLWTTHRQRSRSFGDAEDFLSVAIKPELPVPGDDIHTMTRGLHHRNTGNSTNSNGSSSNNNHGGSIHHRHRHHGTTPQTPRQQGMLGYDFYQTPTPKRKPLHPQHLPHHGHHGHPHYNYFWRRRPSVLKCGLAAGFGCYLLLLVKSSVWLWNTKDEGHRHVAHPPGDVYYGTGSGGDALSYSTWSQDLIVARRTSQAQMEGRAQERRTRTRPPSTATTSATTEWYPIHRMDTRPPSQPAQQPRHRSSSLASLDQICGFAAQNASLADPQHYPSATVLGNAENSARVLITGILNPLGFQLAMYLYHYCGVQVVGGIDAMFPNTVQNRLALVEERLELLHTTIPKLVKPIGLSFLGLDPKHDKKSIDETAVTMTWENMASWKPTHIVHLAAYSQDVYSDAAVDPSWRHPQSPYVRRDAEDGNSPFYALRSSMVAMEQLLQRVAEIPLSERPHILYASAAAPSSSSGDGSNTRWLLQQACKLMDEILAETHGIPSIGLRLPNTIYGPWGQAGSTVHDFMDATAREWDTPPKVISTAGQEESLDMMHVDDAIEAIVAAMQYQTTHPMAMDITSASTRITVPELVITLESLRPNVTNSNNVIVATPARVVTTTYPALAQWHPRISLRQGLVQTMAWHLHRLAPFGPARVETADTFLKRQGQKTCEATDWQCHKSKQFLPCLSECNVRDHCVPSVFDEIQPLIYNVSEGCDIVLYTQSLGYNVQDLLLHAEYMDDSEIKSSEKLICNFAFVPRDSDLVNTVTQKVPNEQLTKFGITPQATDSKKDMRKRKLNGLNGRLLYRGWILFWVPNAMDELTPADRSLLKLSPGKLFHPDVGRAVFMEENFRVSPNLDDVAFLVGEMNRKPISKRTLKKDVRYKTPLGKELVKRQKFRLPPEPRRRAAILFAPLRIPNNPKDSTVRKYKNHVEKKLTIHDAAKFMRYELDKKDPDKEPPRARHQREFYEKVPSYINRNTELRSTVEPWYRYSMRHWVRSRWVVHDTHLEESRLLRCDWYQEHLEWGTELDQLSFAHVMATRELKRRIAHNEPDDHVKTFIEKHHDLKDLTDSYEWHPMETDANKLYREPVHWTSTLPDHVTVDEEAAAEDEEHAHHHEPEPLFVRIMSERVMYASRKVWTKVHKHDYDDIRNKKKN